MIALWAAYALAISALVAVGALCLERAARATRLGARGIWVLAIAASIGAPFVVNAFAAPARAAVGVALTGGVLQSGLGVDDLFFIVWAACSVAVGGALARAAFLLWRDGRTWRDGMLDGVVVRESANAGPAVIGVSRMRIVMPHWVRTLDQRSRSLVLLHELEHAAARDPLLIAFGALALVAMPWNVALWWQVRRLRLAIEIDCDRRVLKREPDARAYALVLLASSERMSSMSATLPACLATPRRSLEPRILAMTTKHSLRRRLVVSAGACLAAAVAIAVACDTPHPSPIAPPLDGAARERDAEVPAQWEPRPQPQLEFNVDSIRPLGRDGHAMLAGDTIVTTTRDGKTVSMIYRPRLNLRARALMKDSVR